MVFHGFGLLGLKVWSAGALGYGGGLGTLFRSCADECSRPKRCKLKMNPKP